MKPHCLHVLPFAIALTACDGTAAGPGPGPDPEQPTTGELGRLAFTLTDWELSSMEAAILVGHEAPIGLYPLGATTLPPANDLTASIADPSLLSCGAVLQGRRGLETRCTAHQAGATTLEIKNGDELIDRVAVRAGAPASIAAYADLGSGYGEIDPELSVDFEEKTAIAFATLDASGGRLVAACAFDISLFGATIAFTTCSHTEITAAAGSTVEIDATLRTTDEAATPRSLHVTARAADR